MSLNEKLLLVILLGALGGFLGHLYRNNGIVFPKKLKQKMRLGFISDILLGGFSAIIVVGYLDFNLPIGKLIVTSLVSGLSFKGVLQREKDKIASVQEKMGNKIDKIEENF